MSPPHPIPQPGTNAAGITVAGGTLDVRGAFSSGSLAVSSGTLKVASNLTSDIAVTSINQVGGSIEISVIGNSADKLVSAGSMTFTGGSLTANLYSAPTAPVVLAEYGSLIGTPTVEFSPALTTTRLSSPVVDAVTGNKVTFTNTGTSSYDDYTLAGAGGIGGLGEGLVRTGNAWLNLGGNHTFAGPVQINGGAVILLTPQHHPRQPGSDGLQCSGLGGRAGDHGPAHRARWPRIPHLQPRWLRRTSFQGIPPSASDGLNPEKPKRHSPETGAFFRGMDLDIRNPRDGNSRNFQGRRNGVRNKGGAVVFQRIAALVAQLR